MASAKQILSYERELKDAGATEKQAEIHARNIADIIESTLVTKKYFDASVKDSESHVNKKFHELEIKIDRTSTELNNKIDRIDSKIEMRITQLESSIYKFLITVMMAMMAVSGAMQTIFHYWK